MGLWWGWRGRRSESRETSPNTPSSPRHGRLRMQWRPIFVPRGLKPGARLSAGVGPRSAALFSLFRETGCPPKGFFATSSLSSTTLSFCLTGALCLLATKRKGLARDEVRGSRDDCEEGGGRARRRMACSLRECLHNTIEWQEDEEDARGSRAWTANIGRRRFAVCWATGSGQWRTGLPLPRGLEKPLQREWKMLPLAKTWQQLAK